MKTIKRLIIVLLVAAFSAVALNNAEAKKFSKGELEKLFDLQIETMKKRRSGKSEIFLVQLRKKKLIETASKMTFTEGNIPFIPVFSSITNKVEYGLRGKNLLNDAYVFNIVPVPIQKGYAGVYFIFDVDLGPSTFGKSPREAEEFLKKQGRSPLTAAEVIAVAFHTGSIYRGRQYFMHAAGSRHVNASRVPELIVSNGVPLLTEGEYSVPAWGTPSCAKRQN